MGTSTTPSMPRPAGETNKPNENPMNKAADTMANKAEGVMEQGKDMANQAANKAEGVVEQGKEMASQAANKVTETVQNAGEQLREQAEGVAGYVGQKAQDAVSYVGQKADGATTMVGERLENLGHTVRDTVGDRPILRDAAGAAASTLESAGQYLEQHALGDMSADISNVVRRNPIPSLLIAAGVGYLLAHATRQRMA